MQEMEAFLKKVITEAGTIAKKYFFEGIDNYDCKTNPDDIVTVADKAVSKFLIDAIHEKFPDHQIMSEEAAEDINPGAEYKWVIDPIDGTRCFAAGIPVWGTLIAILKNNKTILAAASCPLAEQLFFAKKGGGAFLNEKPIHVNTKDSIDYGFGITVRNVSRPYSESYRKAVAWFALNTKARLGNYGSVLHLCYLASGGVDFFFGNGGFDHDYLGPVLIAEEAGVVVTDSTGEPWQPGRNDLIAANPKLHPKILAAFKQANQ